MTGIIPHPLSVEHFVGPALASSMESPLGETSILTTNTSLDRDAEKTKRLSKDPITTSSNQRPTKANGWARRLFSPTPQALVYFHTCAATCCVPCVSVPRERVMRTAGARLKNRGSLTEKWAEAPTLPAASERQSSLVIVGPPCKTRPHALEISCLDAPDRRWPTRTTEMHAVGVENSKTTCCESKIQKAFNSKRQDVGKYRNRTLRKKNNKKKNVHL